MGAFDGMKTATRGFHSNPLKPGRYIVRLDEASFFDTEANGEMWKNTHTILAAEDGPHRVGEVTHSFFRTRPGKKVFQSNVTGFIAGVLDVPDEEVDEEAAMKVVGSSQPFAGFVVPVTATQRVSKTKKTDDGEPVVYTVYTWGRRLTDTEIQETLDADVIKKFGL